MTTVIRVRQNGAPSVLVPETDSIAAPGAGQVRLRHDAIGVNFVDTMFRAGVYPMPLPFVGGVEAAGEIVAVGSDVTDFAIGDRVAYFFAPGAYAEERLIDTAPLVRLPDDVPADVAAGMLTKGITAWLAVRELYPVKAGDVVLVQGATGGVGTLVTRWAKSLGATVIAVGSSTKLARIANEADHALASDAVDLAGRIHAVAPDGVDVVYEFVGKATFEASAAAIKDGGSIFTIGAASGAPDIPEASLAARGVKVAHASAAALVKGTMLEKAAADVFGLWQQGVFGDIELHRYALTDAAKAHEDIAARRIGTNPILLP